MQIDACVIDVGAGAAVASVSMVDNPSSRLLTGMPLEATAQ